ncbi:MAG: hypothetical protein JRI23_11120 [Deltaproteobacteria bacterium]|jgi:hypothetical protein|nr:hypothetical protein [Deltaproteobacteria bacterium]MBW2532233.1 hypothetical protein [Deltaproteobacteria bacterium]
MLFLWVLLAIVALLGGGGMTAALVPYVYDNAVLDQRGVEARATPYEVSAYQQHKTIFHKIDCRFRANNGKQYPATLRTQDKSLIARAEAHEPFTIVYDPEYPKRNRFTADVHLHWSIGLTPLVFALGGLIALLMGLGRLRKRRALVIHGHVAQGVVTSVERISASKSKNVIYQFAAPHGPAAGCWTTRNPPAAGTGVWVIYDPADPTRCFAWNRG